jgi:hypothetical protein
VDDEEDPTKKNQKKWTKDIKIKKKYAFILTHYSFYFYNFFSFLIFFLWFFYYYFFSSSLLSLLLLCTCANINFTHQKLTIDLKISISKLKWSLFIPLYFILYV